MIKTTTVNILGNDYQVGFPKVGHFIQIQTLKAKLTDGYYDTLKSTGALDGLLASSIIDAIATFNTLIGKELHKDLNVDGLLALELDKMVQVATAYREVYFPWYEKQMAEILERTLSNHQIKSKENAEVVAS
jgi:hypothetical protein